MSVNDCSSSSSSTVRILYQTVQLSIKQVDSLMKVELLLSQDRDVGNLCGRYNLKISCEDILLIATPLKG
ncbi:hypothetical protein L1987_10390 [Smallanthus sonchifolius]|uniref:Uncharacterized protein n=1 Tax=Smallanthus sonchifolius TaxID=185202 RepID=A0ACB9JRY7_9ASTR|nr:hypothetical protein L1987_10390 [Smallanthus sonchifolius]